MINNLDFISKRRDDIWNFHSVVEAKTISNHLIYFIISGSLIPIFSLGKTPYIYT